MSVLPSGTYAFPVTWVITPHAPCGGVFPAPPSGADMLQGNHPRGPFIYDIPGTGFRVSVQWELGGFWSAWVRRAALGTGSGVLVRNPATDNMEASWAVVCGVSGVPWYDVQLVWRPEEYASMAPIRRRLDEQDVLVGELWRWSSPYVPLEGEAGVHCGRTTWFWESDHGRNETAKLNSSTLPRAGDQTLLHILR